MKCLSKFLAFAIVSCTCALISCAGPTSPSYQDVTLSVQFALVGYGENYPVNPIGDGGITGTILPQCTASATATGCNDGGTVYCNASAQCTTSAAILLPYGGSVGSCIELYASVTNTSLNPTWTIYPTPVPTATSNVGGFNSNTGPTTIAGANTIYCAPGNPPIYSGAQLVQAQTLGPGGTLLPQGTVAVVVTNPISPSNPANVVSTTVYLANQCSTLVLESCTVAIGMSPTPTALVPLGGTLQLTGYIAGQYGYGNSCYAPLTPPPTTPIAGTALTWEAGPSQSTQYVGGNGTAAGEYGTIVPTGPNTAVYTAPTNYPATKSAVIVLESTACIQASTGKSSILTGGGSGNEGTSTTVTFQ